MDKRTTMTYSENAEISMDAVSMTKLYAIVSAKLHFYLQEHNVQTGTQGLFLRYHTPLRKHGLL